MSMPTYLRTIVEQSLKEIHQNPEHRFEPKKRREIYDAFGLWEDVNVKRSRGQLAVITARYVLPIFEKGFPEVDTPRKLIDMAEKVVLGELDVNFAIREAANGQEVAGRLWGYDEKAISLNATIAGNAAHRALAEAAGVDPFESKVKEVIKWKGSRVEKMTIEDLTDEELAEKFGDTASAAVVAFAYNTEQLKCDPQKFLEFWKWWLTQAIPSAWEITQHSG